MYNQDFCGLSWNVAIPRRGGDLLRGRAAWLDPLLPPVEYVVDGYFWEAGPSRFVNLVLVETQKTSMARKLGGAGIISGFPVCFLTTFQRGRLEWK